MNHYVYRITNKVENKHYYGSRSSKKLPIEDLGVVYFSSSRDKEFISDQKLNPNNYKYKVIKTFLSKKEALSYEVLLHNKFDVGKHSHFYNRAKQTSTKWDTTGVKMKELRSYEVSLETREKIANKLKGNSNHLGHTHTDEAKQKVSQANKGNKYNLGRKHSKEAKAKCSIAKKGNTYAVKHANIYCYSTNTLLAENVNMSKWARENGYSHSALSATTRANRALPSTSKNPHHHKGVYMVYKE